MTKERRKIWGMAWHIFHDHLVGLCYDFEERRQYIKDDKDADEQPTRLRLFKMVKGKLPAEVVAAADAYYKAHRAVDKASDAFRAVVKAVGHKGPKYVATEKRYNKAHQVEFEARKALQIAIQIHYSAIEALHKQECPDCPWDGQRIVFPTG